MQVRGDADTIAFEHCDHFNSIIPNNFMKDNKVFLSGSNGYKVDWVFAWIYKCISLLFGLHARSLWPTYSLARFCRGDLYYRTNWDSKMQPKDRTFFENTNIEFVAPAHSYTFVCPMILVTKRINSWNSLGLVDASHKTTKCVNTEDKRSLVDTYHFPFYYSRKIAVASWRAWRCDKSKFVIYSRAKVVAISTLSRIEGKANGWNISGYF